MKNSFMTFLYLFTALTILLSGCAQYERLDASAPPVMAQVTVSANTENGACTITANTITKTCPFVGDGDPEGVVCQVPSENDVVRQIQWSGEKEFALFFNKGHPFVATSGKCQLGTMATSVTCVLKQDTPANPLNYYYKYDIKVSDGCERDPGIYLIR